MLRRKPKPTKGCGGGGGADAAADDDEDIRKFNEF